MGLKKDKAISSKSHSTYLLAILAILALLIVATVFLKKSSNNDDDEDGFLLATPIDLLLNKKSKIDGGIWGEDNFAELYDVATGEKIKKKNKKRSISEKLYGEGDDSLKMLASLLSSGQKNEILRLQKKILKNQNRAPDQRYNINVTNSDLLSMDRSVPDTRPPICQTFKYNIKLLPKASIIIPFYNEALSMLMRTIHSIINRTPDDLLIEIILVDDCSPDLHLQQPLRDYVKLLPKVKLVRNDKRQGLIVSRMRGARMAKGAVLIFLDAHSEANRRWIEPLLDELRRNPRQILQPFTDAIDAMSLEIGQPGVYHKGSFSWDLRYTWLKVTDQEQAAAHDTGLPFFTPTLVGCAIAVDRKYFEEIGFFDEGLQVWGGENIELGFRAWMCGGKVVTVTCSHMGHVFKEFPYSFDGDKEVIVQKNLIRVAETWMDGLKKYFYASTRIYDFKRAELNEEDDKSLKAWKANRKKLGGCNNFDWFLYNVMPQMERPDMDAVLFGEIMNQKSKACWETTADYKVAITYVCYHHKIIPANNFAITKDGLMRYRDKCVVLQAPNPMLALAECPEVNQDLSAFGQWELINRKSPVIGHIRVGRKNKAGINEYWCIEQMTNVMNIHKMEQMPQLNTCDDNNEFQSWAFTYGFDYTLVPPDAMQ